RNSVRHEGSPSDGEAECCRFQVPCRVSPAVFSGRPIAATYNEGTCGPGSSPGSKSGSSDNSEASESPRPAQPFSTRFHGGNIYKTYAGVSSLADVREGRTGRPIYSGVRNSITARAARVDRYGRTPKLWRPVGPILAARLGATALAPQESSVDQRGPGGAGRAPLQMVFVTIDATAMKA